MNIAVLNRAFTVLEVMARAGWPMTQAALTEECRLPKPTLHRILRNVRDLGYVTQSDRGAYNMTQWLASMRVHSRDQQVNGKAPPLVRRFLRDFGETVNPTIGVACAAISRLAIGEPLAAISVSVPVVRFTTELRGTVVATLTQTRVNPSEEWQVGIVNF